ncbi:MAG: carboxypeptidase-like regulatory domain-containing protein [Fulvivirga sp.]|uniref:carboxypeptidase-like regulatory domain-containing protein n=1 Tax=Fulvivirga sp. TaxID=1931237 RepID=UPI0032EE0ED7
MLLTGPLSFSIAQEKLIEGIVITTKEKAPLEYVNIGIPKKNIGTVSDENGKFVLNILRENQNDTLLISCIGYATVKLPISNAQKFQEITMTEIAVELEEITIASRQVKEKTFGISVKSPKMSAGFENKLLGYECGVLTKNKHQAHLKRLSFNVAQLSYDSIFYRVNIYSKSKLGFENILNSPIYLKLANDEVQRTVSFDLVPYDIYISGDFLVTLEHVKDLGEGLLNFSATLLRKTYYRKTSQGEWQTVPVGISLNVTADVFYQ